VASGRIKRFCELTVDDLRQDPVWEFVHEEEIEDDEVCVRAVTELPVSSVTLRVVGTTVTLSDGSRRWATLSNITLTSRRETDQFLCLSVEHHGAWFEMSRYHDVDYARRGPRQLAEFLGLPIDAVFPITYDISSLVRGTYEATRGTIPSETREILSREERRRLIRSS
jgi:hypothetical protein